MTNYEAGGQMRGSNQMSREYRDTLHVGMQSSEHGTAYLRGASIGEQSDSKVANRANGLSYYNNVDKNVSGHGGHRNEIKIQTQQVTTNGQDKGKTATNNKTITKADLPKINIQLQTIK